MVKANQTIIHANSKPPSGVMNDSKVWVSTHLAYDAQLCRNSWITVILIINILNLTY